METSQKEFLINGINSLLEQIDKVNLAISFHSQLENIDNLVLASYKARKLKYEHELLDLLGNLMSALRYLYKMNQITNKLPNALIISNNFSFFTF